MSGFTENALIRKLQDLNSSQQSIQTLSLWLIHHRKHHAAIVKTWYKELLKAKDSKQLTFMYLANDVIQNSKKKGPEYGKEFGIVLIDALKHMAKTGINIKTKHSLHRILNIWEERGVYDSQKIQDFKVAVDPNDAEPNANKRKKNIIEAKDNEKKPRLDEKKPRVDDKKPRLDEKTRHKEKKERRRSESKSESKTNSDGHNDSHSTSPNTPPGDPPEPEELVKALLFLDYGEVSTTMADYSPLVDSQCIGYCQPWMWLDRVSNIALLELESSASSDEAVRERIASLPPEVSEVQLLSKLEDKESALSLSAIVNSAVELLAEYNLRLSEELEKRRKVATMLRDFEQAQRELAKKAEATLEEYNIKLQKIYEVKAEVKAHIENLPDVSRLPDVTGGLAPLPSAGDLFSI